jgi:tRNA pseudouridine55 synthase
MPRRREEGARIDGILVVAKPSGPTSHDVVAMVRRLTGVRRVGHGGTLDPFAMGVLPLFLGHATRMVEYHLADAKAYLASVALGARSTTDDVDGQLTPGEGPVPTREALELALAAFRGDIDQVPPDHSAAHVGGRRAYEVARGGEKPGLASRRVTIHSLDVVGWDDSVPGRPAVELDVRCSAGTYVRSLARDLGEVLGCGAYLAALTRTASGPFGLDGAHALERVRDELAAGRIEGMLLPPDAGLEHIQRLQVPDVDMAAIARGQIIRVRGAVAERAAGPATAVPGPVDEAGRGQVVRVVDAAGRLAAMARLAQGRLYPEKVFIGPEA